MRSSLLARIDSNRDRIDEPAFVEDIWSRFGVERTVVVVDMAGFTAVSRAKGILHYLTLILEMQALTRPLVEAYRGSVVKYEADNLFAVFPGPTEALDFLHETFNATEALNQGRDRFAQLKISAGLDHGRILLDEHDFFGDAVNLASKLGEDMARTGEVLASQDVVERLGATPHQFEEIGSHGFFGSNLPVFLLKRCGDKDESAT